MLWAPSVIGLLRYLKFWKKKSRSHDIKGETLEYTKKFYEQDEAVMQVPRAGGILIWGTVFLIAGVFFLALKLVPVDAQYKDVSEFLNFIDLRQTYIPMAVLLASALLGLADDYLAVLPSGGNYFAGGLKLSHRMVGVFIISLLLGLWFHLKIGDTMHKLTMPWIDGHTGRWFVLNLEQIHLPLDWLDSLFDQIFGFNWNLENGGWLIIPLTIIVITGLWGSSVIDGFDGLTAGVLIPILLCLTALAFVSQYYQTASMMAVVSGATAAYLWYNIPPARFYMGDTGSTALLILIGTVTLLIDKLFVLPIMGFVLLITVGSNIVQVFSKKFFKRKVFLAAPIHHHFEALGWKREQVTMRFWLISIICSMLALALGLIVGNYV